MRFIALFALLLATSLAGGQATGQEPTAAQAAVDKAIDATVVEPPIIIDSDTTRYDLRSGVTRSSGNVTIQRGAMVVNADEGVVHQADGRMTLVELFGSPTTWLDRLDDGSVVEGQAKRIQFDVIENVVTLIGDARLRHEQGEFTGDELVYDLDTESLAGRGSDGNQARVVLEGDSMRRRASGENSGDNGSARDDSGNDEPSPEPDPEPDPEPGADGDPDAEEEPPLDPPAGR